MIPAPPSDFTVQVISRSDQVPDTSVTAICLDIDSLGSFAAGLAWATKHKQDNLFIAIGRVGGDMTALSEFSCASFTPRDTNWRKEVHTLWWIIRHPEYEDPPSSEPGAVSREEFEEHLRAHNVGESDDGGTC